MTQTAIEVPLIQRVVDRARWEMEHGASREEALSRTSEWILNENLSEDLVREFGKQIVAFLVQRDRNHKQERGWHAPASTPARTAAAIAPPATPSVGKWGVQSVSATVSLYEVEYRIPGTDIKKELGSMVSHDLDAIIADRRKISDREARWADLFCEVRERLKPLQTVRSAWTENELKALTRKYNI